MCVSFTRGIKHKTPSWLVGTDTPVGHDDDAAILLAQAAFWS